MANYQHLKIHKVEEQDGYEFMNSRGKIKLGTIQEARILVSCAGTQIYYIVECDQERVHVDHDTNREI